MPDTMNKNISMVLAFGLLLAAILLSGPQKIISSMLLFRRDLIVPILLLSFANFTARFVRWDILTRCAGIKIRLKESLLIFFSSFLFSIAPAKSGDLIKPYYLKKYTGTKYALSLPVIFLERVYDVLGILLLIFVSGALYFGEVVLFTLFFGVIIATFFIETIVSLLLKKKCMAFFGKRGAHIKEALRTSKELFSRKISLVSLGLGASAWLFECAGLYLVVSGFGVSADIIRETLIYSIATLGGAASMLPGGLGATEGGMAYLLSNFAGTDVAMSVSITLVIRALTLWIAVLIGFFANLMLVRTEPQKK